MTPVKDGRGVDRDTKSDTNLDGGQGVLMFCRECGASIEDDSKFCRQCGKPQTSDPASEAAIPDEGPDPEPAAPAAKKSIPTWLIVTCAVVFLIFVIGIVSGTPKTGTPDANQADLNAAANAAIADVAAATSNGSADAPTAAPENWSYSSDTDKVRGGTTYFATTTSTNTIHQNAPYDSDTSMTMTVRHSPSSGLNILLSISSGQMMCPSYEGCSGTVRFDNGSAERISFNGPADEDSETIFVSNARSFLAKLRKAKHVVVEKTLYEAGAPQFEFDVHGLKWDH